MNIIYARMTGYDWVSTPSDAVARELEKLEHNITILENISYIPPKKYDFVWSPYESVTILGDAISKKLDIPHFSHMEWIPPWRVLNKCDAKKYGYSGNEEELSNINHFKEYYNTVGKAYLSASVRTLSTNLRLSYMQKLLDSSLDPIYERYPSVDTDTINKAKKMFFPKKSKKRIISISRLVPDKRWDLLVKITNEIRTEAEWCIIGEGPMTEYVKKESNNQNITLNFLGPLWGWNKLYELMKSYIFLGGMTAMPPIEATLLNVHPVVICGPPTDEIPEWDKLHYKLFNNKIPTFKHNEIG